MKVAYCITAYTDPEQLARLIKSLEYGDINDFFVHIDKKVEIDKFKRACDGLKINWIEDRKFVCWAGYSQVDSILALLKSVINKNIEYDRVTLISGCDYPVWSNEEIVKFYEKNKEKELMIGFNISNCSNKKQLQKIEKYHIYDLPIKNRNILKAFTKIINTILKVLPINKKKYIELENGQIYDIYFSSDYWSLSFSTVKKLYNTYINSQNMKNYFKSAFAPSELFMATLLFNSDMRKNAYFFDGEYKGLSYLTFLQFIDYSNGILILNEDDYSRIKASKKMFFRKAYTNVSDQLIELIEKER